MDRPGVRQVPEGCGEQGKMEKIGCKIFCGAPMTPAFKGLMMMVILLSPLMNVVLGKLQDNPNSYKITKMIFNGESKGGACVRHLHINSNTHARPDYRLSMYVRSAAAQ